MRKAIASLRSLRTTAITVALFAAPGLLAADESSPTSQQAINSGPPGVEALATQAAESPADSESQDVPPAPAPPKRPILHFEQLTLDVGFDSHWDQRETSSDIRRAPARNYSQTDDVRHFEETMGLRGNGDLIDERFLRYQFDVRGGFWQETDSESKPGRDLYQNPHGGVLRYDARAILFPTGTVTANLFASNLQDRLPRLFLPSLDRVHERYGAELLYNDRILPMRLSFEDEYESLTSFTRTLEDNERRSDRRMQYEATWQPSDDHHLRFEYEYDDSHEQYSGSKQTFDTTRDYFALNDVVKFGDDGKSRLDTLARFQNESGNQARDVSEVVPQLRLQHTDSLASTYRAQYLHEAYEGITLDTYRGDVGLSHHLNEWVDSGINFYALTQDADKGGDVREWGGTATASFNREHEIGRFSANATYDHAWERGDNGGDDGVVVAESATFHDPIPVFLTHTDVRLPSILVTDAARRRTFLVGRDYYIVPVGRYTTLQRSRRGNIADGQTVLVSYLYRTAQGYELTRDRLDLRVQETFKNGWSPYYATSLQVEDIDRTRYRGYVPRDVNRQHIGVDYRQARWSAGTEFEYNDDTIDPYQAVHFRGDAVFLDKLPHSLSGRGTFSFFSFNGADNGYELVGHDASLLDLGLSYRCLFNDNLEANASAAYRFEDDTLYGITHGVDLRGSLNWKLGLFFTAVFELEYDQLRLPGSNEGTFVAWIKLRRDIPIIGRPDR